MRKFQPLPEDETECLTPTALSASPFSEAMEDAVSASNGSAPDLLNHPHLDNSMRSLSTSVAARRKEYAVKRAQAEDKPGQTPSSLSRAQRMAFMKRTRSVSSLILNIVVVFILHLGFCHCDAAFLPIAGQVRDTMIDGTTGAWRVADTSLT